MKNTTQRLLLLATILLGQAVSSFAQKDYINVLNLNTAQSITDPVLIYSLPQNKLKIRLTAVKKMVVSGPFQQYAEKYLGEPAVNTSDKVAWEVSKLDLYTLAIPDTSHYYAVQASGPNYANFISLTDEGYLQAINSKPSKEELDERQQNNDKAKLQAQDKFMSYSRLSLSETLVEVIDTVYKEIQQDTMVVTVPIVRRQLVQKTQEQKAAEIAKLIFALRDDKNALLIGESDGKALPDGNALAQMLRELNKLEQDYMSLFIGKSWQEVHQFEYEFQPNASHKAEQKVLCRFSSTFGVLPASDMRGSPILLTVTNDNAFTFVQNFLEQQQASRRKPLQEHGIAYRIPGLATVEVTKSNKTLVNKQLRIAQYGIINRLPVNLLKRNDYRIEFNTTYGSLIDIRSIAE